MILFTINSYSQTIKEIDSVATKFCEYIKSTENIENDSIRINQFYQTQFDPFLSNFENEKVDKTARQLFYRLQRNCLDFSLLLDRLYPPKENINRITEKPKTKLTDKEIKEFWNRKTFKYYENNGNETIVQISNNQWKDVFTDSTYSKLKYKEINNYENLYIPGYNRTYDSSAFGGGFGFNLSYLVPIFKKDKVVIQEKEVEK